MKTLWTSVIGRQSRPQIHPLQRISSMMSTTSSLSPKVAAAAAADAGGSRRREKMTPNQKQLIRSHQPPCCQNLHQQKARRNLPTPLTLLPLVEWSGSARR